MTTKPEMPELLPCGQCGMLASPSEFHPYAACLMFKGCHDAKKVRSNLQFVLDHGNTRADLPCKEQVMGADLHEAIEKYGAGSAIPCSEDLGTFFIESRLFWPLLHAATSYVVLQSRPASEEKCKYCTDPDSILMHRSTADSLMAIAEREKALREALQVISTVTIKTGADPDTDTKITLYHIRDLAKAALKAHGGE